MSAKKSAPVVIVKAPALNTAWTALCNTSAKSEKEIVAAILNMAEAMTKESRLTVRDMEKFIKGTGKTSAFVKVSHVRALPTLATMRKNVKGFSDMEVSKQLSTAASAYDLLGAGKGENIANVDALKKEIATMRKAKQSPKKSESKSAKESKSKNPLAEIRAYLSAVDVQKLSDSDLDIVAEIATIVESMVVNA